MTHRLYLDMGLCPEGVRANRTLGDKTILCTEPQPLGRIVIDLYGRAAPGSVGNIIAAAQAGAYNGSALSKVVPGQYLLAGTQGPRRMGLVQAPEGLEPNPDILSASAFRLPHRRPGTVSLNLSGAPGLSGLWPAGHVAPAVAALAAGRWMRQRCRCMNVGSSVPVAARLLPAVHTCCPCRRSASVWDAENEDEDFIRFGKNYRNLSLLITTGPGPVPSLDGENIVVGSVSGEQWGPGV